MSFSDFNLQKDFISSIEAAGYKSPTPLQAQLIPLVEEKKDTLIWTQSASGKTGAFLIPAMNYILENPAPEKRGARVLILTSRRDRVSQINYTIKRLSKDHLMRFGFIVSGRPYQTQMRLMRRPLDIMIATPGRLNDLMKNGKADFSQLEMLIIDDLTSIYQKNLHGLVEQILQQAGPDCTSLTFLRANDEITPYAQSLFPDAIQIIVDDEDSENPQSNESTHDIPNKQTTVKKESVKNQPKTVEPTVNAKDLMPQKVHIADDYTHKIAMMDYLMDEYAGDPTIIYTATNKSAETLLENLANHGHAAELIQDLSPEEIDDCDILIVSDQERFELSTESISKNDKHIIHFDLPRRTDKYLERLNRHNQDRESPSLLIIDGYNYNELKHIEKILGEKLDLVTVPGLEPLKPFVNLSRNKPANKSRSNSKPNHNKNARNNNKPRQSTKGRPNNNNRNKNQRNTAPGNNENSNTDNKRRQRKGPFGRLNGGANRKTGAEQNNNSNHNNGPKRNANSGRNTGPARNNNRRSGPKIGVSSRGTGTPKDGRGWQSDFAAPQERKTESKSVVIRYSKKRTIVKDSDKDET